MKFIWVNFLGIIGGGREALQEQKQKGNLRKKNGSWVLLVYVTDIGPDGQPVRRQVTKTLARVFDQFRKDTDLDELVDAELALVNRGSAAEVA